MTLDAGVRGASTIEAVAEEVAFAHCEVDLLRAHLKAAGVEPGRLRSESDLLRIPLTGRNLYRSAGLAGVARSWRGRMDALVCSHGSGTDSGEVVPSWADPAALAARVATLLEIDTSLAAALDRMVGRGPIRIAPRGCTSIRWDSGPVISERVLSDGTLVVDVGDAPWPPDEARAGRAASEIASWPASWLYADPVSLAILVTVAPVAAEGLKHIDATVLTYSMCLAGAGRRIRAVLPQESRITDVLSLSELGWVGIACRQGSLHMNTADFRLEVLDPDDQQPVAEGGIGELTVTTIGERVMPRLRYATGDLCSVEPACSCGHPAAVLRFHGRLSETLRFANGRVVTPRLVDDAIGSHASLLLHQLEQRTPDSFVLHCLPDPDLIPAELESVAESLRQVLPARTEIEVRSDFRSLRPRRGKFRSVAPLRSEVGLD